MKKLLLVLALCLFTSSAFAQCNGVFPTNTACANSTGGSALPKPVPFASIGAGPGGSSGQIQFNNGSGGFGGLPRTGTGGNVATSTGTLTSGDCASINANGDFIDFGSPCTPATVPPCTVAVTNPSNALSIALLNSVGGTPSAGAPCSVTFRNATAATGNFTTINVTAAATFTTGTTGSTFGSTNNTPFRLWITLWNNAGTVAIGVSNQTTALTTFSLLESIPSNTTACSACTNATAAGTFYTTAALTGAPFTVFAYLDYGSGLTTAGTYASTPTLVALRTPSVPLPGWPIQSVTGSAQTPVSQTTTTYASSGLTVTLSPRSAANPVVCFWAGAGSAVTTGSGITVALLRGGTVVGFSVRSVNFSGTSGGGLSTLSNFSRDLPGTTASTTYTVQFHTNAGGNTATFPYGNSADADGGAILTCTELAA
jgi:hypothetical protein